MSSSKGKTKASQQVSATGPTPSKLAFGNDLSAAEETEISEAFELFAQPFPNDDNDGSLDDEYADRGVVPIKEVRRALMYYYVRVPTSCRQSTNKATQQHSALNLSPASKTELQQILGTLDPAQTGYTTYGPFVSVCALKLQSQTSSSSSAVARQRAEVEAAFRLFTGADAAAAGGNGRIITIRHLRRVARELKLSSNDNDGDEDGVVGNNSSRKKKADEVGEEMLKDMILEANGGAGVERGVRLEEFENIMRRAGVF